jgi:hypothetical protein
MGRKVPSWWPIRFCCRLPRDFSDSSRSRNSRKFLRGLALIIALGSRPHTPVAPSRAQEQGLARTASRR